MADDKYEAFTPEQLRQLRHHPAIVAKITEIARRYCANANAIARDVRAEEVHVSEKQKQKAAADQFEVVVQNHMNTERPRAYVRPVGKTGMHVEAGHSVLFKAIATMGGQADMTTRPTHPTIDSKVFQGIAKESQ